MKIYYRCSRGTRRWIAASDNNDRCCRRYNPDYSGRSIHYYILRLRFVRKRQSWKRIDRHERIVSERNETFRHSLLWRESSDSYRIEASGTSAAVGRGNTGMPEQRFVSKSVV